MEFKIWWAWMGLAAIFVLVEIFRRGSFFFWISIGAAASGILALLDTTPGGQIAVFFVISGILVLLERRFLERYTFKNNLNLPVVDETVIGEADNTLNVFRQSGKVWEVKYQGVSFTVKHSIGLVHIRNLIIHAGTWMHCSELKRISSGNPGDCKHNSRKTMTEAQARIENLTVGNNVSPETLVDRLSLDKIKKLRDLLAEKKQSDNFDTPEERIDQLKTLEFIEKYLETSTDIRGRSRKIMDREDTDRKAVSVAIIRSRNSLSENKDLFIHLKSFIQAEGNSFRYLPDRPIDWKTH